MSSPNWLDSDFSSVSFFSTCSSRLFQLLGAIHLAHEVAQLGAGLQQRAQRRDLLRDAGRLEILDRIELEIDGHFAAVLGKLVVDAHLQPRGHPGHDIVEIIPVDLDELAIGQRAERLRRIAGEVAHDADDERKLAQHFGTFGLDLVGDVHPRLTDAIELVVDTRTHGLASPFQVRYVPTAPIGVCSVRRPVAQRLDSRDDYGQ